MRFIPKRSTIGTAVLFLMVTAQPRCGGVEYFGPTSVPTQTQAFATNRSLPSEDSRGESLFSMSTRAFFKLSQVNQRMDMQNLNHTLLSAAVFHETNQRRQEYGRTRLDHLPRLDEAARIHAQSMARYDYLSHTNPRQRNLRTPGDRLKAVGLKPSYYAENVATHFGIQYESGTPVYRTERRGETQYSYNPGGPPIPRHTYRSFAESLLDQWMRSSGHRGNILSGDPEFLGAACEMGGKKKGMYEFYCAQVFFAR